MRSPARSWPWHLGGSASLRTAALLAIASVFVVAWQGYSYGDSNHSIQIPLQRAAEDPTLFQRDLLRLSAPGYATYFFSVLTLLDRVAGHPEALAFVLYVGGHLAALGAIFALGRVLFRHRTVAGVACLLYVVRPPALAGESSYYTQLTHAHVAGALLLWAVWLHLRGRPVWAFALVGATANLHALYALHVAALLGLDLVLRRRSVGLRGLAAACGAFTVAAAPILAWLARSSTPLAPELVSEWLAIMRERSPQHTFPLTQPAAVYGGYALFLGLVATLGRLPAREGPRRVLLHLLAGVVLLCVLGLVFSEVQPVPLLIRAQVLRSTRWLTLLALPVLSRGLVGVWGRGGLARAGAALACVGLAISQLALLAPALLLVLVGERRRLTLERMALGCLVLVLAALSSASELGPDLALGAAAGLVRGVFASPVLSGLVALFVLTFAARTARPAALRSAVPVLAAVAALALAVSVERRARLARLAEPWYEVQRWAHEHTPRNALLLTPPYRQGFRVFSERSVVGEWKDGTQQFFSPAFGFEWHRRMRALRAPSRAYERLEAAELLDLARAYGADYVVTAARRQLPLPLLFRNAEWSVYGLPAGG